MKSENEIQNKIEALSDELTFQDGPNEKIVLAKIRLLRWVLDGESKPEPKITLDEYIKDEQAQKKLDELGDQLSK